MTRIPTWAKLAGSIGLFFLLLLAAMAFRVYTEQLPDNAQPVIAARFDGQLDELRRLAVEMPLDACAEIDLATIQERIELIRAWRDRVEDSRRMFDDPVILEAEIVSSCEESRTSYSVKTFESGGPMWRPSVRTLPDERPAVTLWYAGFRPLALYEDDISESPGGTARLRLLLDLDGLDL